MKKIFMAVAVLLIIACFWHLATRSPDPSTVTADSDRNFARLSASPSGADSENPEDSRLLRRPTRQPEPEPTHEPEQLKDFVLPAVEIQNLTLREALEQVTDAYRKGCQTTGEVPIRLTFQIQENDERQINLKFKGGRLETVIQLLANIAGFSAQRDGSHFRLTRPEPLDGHFTRTFNAPPDITKRLHELSGQTATEGKGLKDGFKSIGYEYGSDPESSLTFFPANSTVLGRTNNSLDFSTMENTLNLLRQTEGSLYQSTSTIFTIPKGADFPELQSSYLDETTSSIAHEKLDKLNDAIVQQIPSSVSSSPNSTLPNHGDDFKIGYEITKVGFGRNIDVAISDSIGNPILRDSGFQNSDGIWLSIRENPDGSRTGILIRTIEVDAVGRPVHKP